VIVEKSPCGGSGFYVILAFMWPFTRTTAAATDERLEKRLEEIERKLRTIDQEWSEWYDKYRRLYARIAKRVERDSDDAPQSRQDAPGATKRAEVVPDHLPLPRRNLRGF
jgi:hypothetical protein